MIASASQWDVRPSDPQRAQAVAAACGVELLVGQLLLNRGIDQSHAARRFFTPTLETLSDPFAIIGMIAAVTRIDRAIRARHPILVFGDSDVDGITAATIVYDALLARQAEVSVVLSDRLQDGYGFPPALIPRLVQAGVRLVVMVDCGTNQPEEIRALARHGIDTVVLDHHLPSAGSAQPSVLVNARVHGGAGDELCSAGLALKLAQGLLGHADEQVARMLDLAALGTLADCVPLIGDNRAIVMLGTTGLPSTHRPGLQRLCESVGVTHPTPDQLLRQVVPRLNAAGRLGDAMPVFRLLTATSGHPASRLADQLAGIHADVKLLYRRTLQEAYEQVNRLHFKDRHALVIGRRGWPAGLMGPIASQLMQQYGRPVVTIALDADLGTGSGRAPEGFNLFEAFTSCQSLLLRYGGHPQACGLTVKLDQLERFRDALNQHAARRRGYPPGVKRLSLEAEAQVQDLTPRAAADIERLKPFGPGNRKPLLLLRQVRIEIDGQSRWMSDGACRLRIAGRLPDPCAGGTFDVVVSVGWSGSEVVVSLYEARGLTGLSGRGRASDTTYTHALA